MSDREHDIYGDILAASTSMLAETALRQIHELTTAGAAHEEIHEVAVTSVALLNLQQQAKSRRGRKRQWLAKVTSFTFPRTFSTGPLPKTDDIDVLLKAGRRHHHVCFTVQITDGGKHAVGREVEVQLPADEAMRLGPQMVRIAEYQLAPHRAGGQAPPSEGDRVT